MPLTLLARARLHPVHAILLSFPIALFVSALASDITYLNTEEIQWSNLSQWAITGALLFGAPVLVWAVVDWLRSRRTALHRGAAIYLGLVAAMWLLGLINAFKHGQDAWSSVGSMGVLMSVICSALALAAGWIAHSAVVTGEAR
jgi:uncharacterized membrane protein